MTDAYFLPSFWIKTGDYAGNPETAFTLHNSDGIVPPM